MSLLSAIPKIFYADIQPGLDFFIDGLGFTPGYHDETLYVVLRDGVRIMLIKDAESAKGDRPELRIVTDDIESIYNEIKARRPEILHPNLNYIKQQPWGLKEFATLDPSTVCIIFQQD